jgi:hypothetical protein
LDIHGHIRTTYFLLAKLIKNHKEICPSVGSRKAVSYSVKREVLRPTLGELSGPRREIVWWRAEVFAPSLGSFPLSGVNLQFSLLKMPSRPRPGECVELGNLTIA